MFVVGKTAAFENGQVLNLWSHLTEEKKENRLPHHNFPRLCLLAKAVNVIILWDKRPGALYSIILVEVDLEDYVGSFVFHR